MRREILGGLLCIALLVPPVLAGEGESPAPSGRGNRRGGVVPEGKERARKGRPKRIQQGPGQRTGRAPGQLVMWPRMNGVDTAHYAIAHIYLREAKYKKAIKQLRKVIEASPTKVAKPLTHWNIGNIYRHRLSDTDKAIGEFEKIIEREWVPRAERAIAQMNEAAQRYERVIKLLRERVSETEDKQIQARLLLHMGAVQQRMGKSKEAIATFNEIISNFNYEDLARKEGTRNGENGEEPRERLKKRREKMRRRLEEWREERDREDEDDDGDNDEVDEDEDEEDDEDDDGDNDEDEDD